MKTIEVFVRSVYGAHKAYPANDAAELLAEIAGTKTLDPKTLALAERLGFEIKQVADPKAPKLVAREAGRALEAAYPFGYRSNEDAP